MTKIKQALVGATVAALGALPLLALAQTTTVGASPITSVQSLITFLQALLRFLFVIFGILAIIMILWSAVLFLTAGANEERRKQAGAFLQWGVIAIIVAIVSFTIIPIVQTFVGLT